MKCDDCDNGECGCGTIVGEDVSSLGRLVLDRFPGRFVWADQLGFIWDDDEAQEGLLSHNSMSLVWSYTSIPDAEFEDIDEDVDDIPPTKQNVYSWWVFTMPAKKLVLIEAASLEHASQLAFDEFGVKTSSLFSQNFVDLPSALAQYSLCEADLRRTKEYKLWSRTRDRKILRSDMDGMNCCECNNFYQFAIANLPGGKMKCFSCKNG